MSSESTTEATRLATLPALNAESGTLNVVVETPKGSRSKFKYDEKLGLFRLAGLLPEGHNFPFDFGFVPSTLAEDGDPLDVLVLLDAPTPMGCLVEARPIGVILAEQTEEGETVRNDRIIAVSVQSRLHSGIERLDQINPRLLDEIEHFFRSYNEAKGKQFKVLDHPGPEEALRIIQASVKQ